jgi:hypothetical protein
VKPSETSADVASPPVPTVKAPGVPDERGTLVSEPGANFSRSSTRSRCASFFPTPGSVLRNSASPASIPSRSLAAVAPLRIPMARRGPIPETEIRFSKRLRSASSVNP